MFRLFTIRVCSKENAQKVQWCKLVAVQTTTGVGKWGLVVVWRLQEVDMAAEALVVLPGWERGAVRVGVMMTMMPFTLHRPHLWQMSVMEGNWDVDVWRGLLVGDYAAAIWYWDVVSMHSTYSVKSYSRLFKKDAEALSWYGRWC